MTELAEGARLESVCPGNGTVGSNPSLSVGNVNLREIDVSTYSQ